MKKDKGVTLIIAIITTSMLLLVSFVLVNITLKELEISFSNLQTEYAFYNADSGIECALYWDVKHPNTSDSAFSTSTPGIISCNGQTINTNSQSNIPPPSTSANSIIGGGGNGNPKSVFMLTFTKGCAIVYVTKSFTGTTIDSRGYNTCSTTATRRFERGVTLTE